MELGPVQIGPIAQRSYGSADNDGGGLAPVLNNGQASIAFPISVLSAVASRIGAPSQDPARATGRQGRYERLSTLPTAHTARYLAYPTTNE